MDCQLRNSIRELMDREVVMATGCTEPVAVALCVTKAREVLGCMPTHTELKLSKNVFKNAMGVGIPGTGMIGLPIAVAMAVVSGDSSRLLNVLNQSEQEVKEAKQWLANHAKEIEIGVKEECDKLYIECTCSAGDNQSTAIISHRHTNFVHVSKNGKVLMECKEADGDCNQKSDNEAPKLSVGMVYEYATTAPLEEIEFILETAKLNCTVSKEGMKGYGLNSGKILMENAKGDLVHTIIARTVAASDARMDGCTLPVYSNSGSGNQGIACTVPVYEYGKEKNCSEEQITRALIMSHLMSIYIKQGIGRLSALCGIVNASIGVSCGIGYLSGGSLEQIGWSIKNMINTLAGMVCDGAKPSCALKMTTGLYSAFVSAELALHNKVVDPTDGLSETDVDFSIRNLGRLGHDGMNETDDMVLDIMTHKQI